MLMKKISLCILLLNTFLNAQEFSIIQKAPFDILNNTYESCEKKALNNIDAEAIRQYIGCDIDVHQYSVQVSLRHEGERSINEKECSVEATVDVKSEFLDNNTYYLGKEGLLCAGYNLAISKENEFYNSLEIGMFVGVTGTHESIQMDSSDSSIYLTYSNVPILGIQASYIYKIFTNQYIGANVLLAKGFESYSDSSSSAATVREDGNPSILRVGVGGFWGYRYHIKTDFSLGVNYVMDSLTRTYTNNTYTANIANSVAFAQVGYFLLPYMKVWGSVSSDVSANVGLSYVY